MNRALIKSFIPPVVLEARRRLKYGPASAVTAEAAKLGYYRAEETIAAAKAAGLSICEHRERLAINPKAIGRRDRTMAKIAETGALTDCRRMLEIGPGTGMYLEKALELAKPEVCEIYEIDDAWARFLVAEYDGRHGCKVVRRAANGEDLSHTADASCDIVFAHGVFVYLPMLRSVDYLAEAARVTKPGGYIAFDCFLASSLAEPGVVEAWKATAQYYPVAIPDDLLTRLAEKHGLVEATRFSEVYNCHRSDYFVWRKT
jgi:phospholipid N-methyltransferase